MRTLARSSRAYDVFVEELIQLRRRAGLSQQVLASQLGIDAGAVKLSEAGRRRVDVVELQLWTTVCGSSLTDFMSTLDRRLQATGDVSRSSRRLH